MKDIPVYNFDISLVFGVKKELNYNGRDVYIVYNRSKKEYAPDSLSIYALAFYDDRVSMYAVIGITRLDYKSIIDNNYQEKDVLNAISRHEQFFLQYFTSFSEAEKSHTMNKNVENQ